MGKKANAISNRRKVYRCRALDSTQILRVQPGTQIIISEGKGHFVAVAEGDEPVEMIVVSPKIEVPRIVFPTSIERVA